MMHEIEKLKSSKAPLWPDVQRRLDALAALERGESVAAAAQAVGLSSSYVSHLRARARSLGVVAAVCGGHTTPHVSPSLRLSADDMLLCRQTADSAGSTRAQKTRAQALIMLGSLPLAHIPSEWRTQTRRAAKILAAHEGDVSAALDAGAYTRLKRQEQGRQRKTSIWTPAFVAAIIAASQDPTLTDAARGRLRAVRLRQAGVPASQVAQRLGYVTPTVTCLCWLARVGGVGAVIRGRMVWGPPPAPTPERARLEAILCEAHIVAGRATRSARAIVRAMSERGEAVSASEVMETLEVCDVLPKVSSATARIVALADVKDGYARRAVKDIAADCGLTIYGVRYHLRAAGVQYGDRR